MQHAASIMDGMGNLLGAVAISGVFRGSLLGACSTEQAERQRCKLRAEKVTTWRPDANQSWQRKVEELADRGFTLQALLTFYQGLGRDYMHGFDGGRHTTEDVVRRAIIPLSEDSCTAYSSIMMNNVPTRPEKMVTHNWSNLFRDLVAAIVSDALGEPEYAMIAYLLDNDLEQLERWVYGLGKGGTTYWVCAFSVNQHTAICGGNPQKKTDTVTGVVHRVCPCTTQKAWNDSSPCRDGKSVACEMNKFDDMMAMLAAEHEEFEQVVAIDKEFQLFTRAWCVAELATASEMGMTQRVKVCSCNTLDRNEEWLKQLRVADMNASRPQDKIEILEKIKDKETFDSSLQVLLFENLFPKWHSLDTTDQMNRVGRIVRWQHLCKMQGHQGIWDCLVDEIPSVIDEHIV